MLLVVRHHIVFRDCRIIDLLAILKMVLSVQVEHIHLSDQVVSDSQVSFLSLILPPVL